MASTSRQAEARIKQLCSLGVPMPVLVPELVAAIKELLGFAVGAIDRCDRAYEFYGSYLYSDVIDPSSVLTPLHEAGLLPRWSDEVLRDPRQIPGGTVYGVETMFAISRRELEKHSLYHHAVRPLGSDGDGLLVMLNDGDLPLGRLISTRGGKETEFTRADSQALAELSGKLLTGYA